MNAGWRNASLRLPCPVCGKRDWCSISEGRTWACCRRVDAGATDHRVDSAGIDYWLHRLGDGPALAPDDTSVRGQGAERAAPEQIDEIYRDLLQRLSLTDVHHKALRQRGLDDEQIAAGHFRSLPEKGRSSLAKPLVDRFGPQTCAKIPGLYIKEEGGRQWWSLLGPAGLLVPVCNLQRRIVALKVRRDDNDEGPRYCYVSSAKHGGPGPGAPVHVPATRPEPSGLARITEGELKALVAGAHSSIFTISIGGVALWRKAIPVLRDADIARVLLAFDADCRTNAHVANSLKSALDGLRADGFQVGIETWDPACGKGIDDVLAAGHATKQFWGADAATVVTDFLAAIQHRLLPIEERLETLARRPGEKWPELVARLAHGDVLQQISVAKGMRRHCIDVASARLGLSEDERKDLRDAVQAAESRTSGGDQADRTVEDGKTERLIAIGLRTDLFTDESDEPFAVIKVDSHCEVHPVNSGAYKGWLSRELYHQDKQSCSDSTIAAALRLLSASAKFDRKQRAVHVRVANDGRNVWYDLGDSTWRAIRVGPHQWEIVDRPTVLFRRFANGRPQVAPRQGGSLQALRDLLHLRSERDWCLLVSWLIAALIPGSPRCALVLMGEQGSAKSTTTKMLRALVDPARALTVRLPRDVAELAQMATHSWALAFDNLTSIPDEISDALCGVVTGDGFQKRKLFTDSDDIVYEYRRVLLLNGIGNFVVKPDLLDRSLIVRLVKVPKEQRRPEALIWKDFEAVRSEVFGAMLDTLVEVLRVLDEVETPNEFRMADAARIGVAVQQVMHWPAGTFEHAMSGNAREQVEEAIEASAFAQELIRFVRYSSGRWSGTASDLLLAINARVSSDLRRSRGWPPDPTRLSGTLGSLAPVLRAVGIDVVRGDRKGGTGTRFLHLTLTEDPRQSREPGEDDDRVGDADAP